MKPFFLKNLFILGIFSSLVPLFIWQHPFAGIFGFLGLISYLLYHILVLLTTPLFLKIPWRSFWLGISIINLFVIIQSFIYFFWVVNPISILISAVIVSFTIHIYKKFSKNYNQKISKLKLLKQALIRSPLLFFIILGFQLLLFFLIISRASTGLLPSPWHLFGPKFFILSIITIFLILYFLYKQKKSSLGLILVIFQTTIFFTLAAILYRLGYGYDPFLHRATEMHIFEYGFALPKTPFYIGQFISVTALAHLLNISTRTIDIWLVPSLASFLIPMFGYACFRFGFQTKKSIAMIGSLLLALYPLKTMIATTPHNLANILTLSTILLTPVYLKNKKLLPLIILLAIVAMAIHPLSGIFAFWFMLGIVFFHYFSLKNIFYRFIYFGYLFFGAILTPTLFGIYLWLQGNKLESFNIIKQNLEKFWSLFKEPYYFLDKPVPFLLDYIYSYRYIVIILLILFAIKSLSKIQKPKATQLFWIFPILLFINALFAATWLNIPNLHVYEQLQYAQRLLHISIFFLLPYSIFTILKFIEKTKWKKISFITLAILLITSWYLTYPQKNEKVNFPGFNVTIADHKAAKLIHELGQDKEYIVLSNILTAAASIDKYGFFHYIDTNKETIFYYSIPSGGVLYQEYLNMLYNGQKREYMEKAMNIANVDTAFFVINDYWVNFEKIILESKNTADAAYSVSGGSVWIFQYSR